MKQIQTHLLQTKWGVAAVNILAEESIAIHAAEFDEDSVERGSDGRFAPQSDSGSSNNGGSNPAKGKPVSDRAATQVGATPKEYQAAVESIGKKLKTMDTESAAAFDKLLQSKELQSLQGEMAKAVTGAEVKGAEKGLQAAVEKAHAAEHAHPSTAKAVSLGLVFDALMGGLVKQLDGLTHLEEQGETQFVGDVGRLSAAVMGPILIFYGNFAPELLLGAAVGEALITASVSTTAVIATNENVTKKLEEKTKEVGEKLGEKAHEVIPGVTPEMGEAIAEKVVETVLMTLSAATAREGYMRLKAKGAEGKTMDKLHESLTHLGNTGDQARDMIHAGESAGKIQQHLEANLSKKTVSALNKVSKATVKAKKKAAS